MRPVLLNCVVLFIAASSVAAEPSYAIPESEEITARCVGVHDGDTITLIVDTNTGKRQARIRLDAIDAPEIGQPFGNRSKQTLSSMVFGKDCKIESMGQDKYGRTIGRVTVDARDVNLAMLEAGMAWHYTKYDNRSEFTAGEARARKSGVGLWTDPFAIPPWHWRKMPKSERDGVRQDALPEVLK